MNIILMVGLPGSGKSSYIDEHLKDYQLICSDDILETIGQEFYTTWVINKSEYVLNKSAVQAVEQTTCESLMKRGRPIVIDSLNLNKEKIKYWIDLADKYHYIKEIIILKIEIDTCLLIRDVDKEIVIEYNNKLEDIINDKKLLNRFDQINIREE